MFNEEKWMMFQDCPIPEHQLVLAQDWCNQYAMAVANPDDYKEETGQAFDVDTIIMGHVATITEWAMELSQLVPGTPMSDEELTRQMERVLMFGQNIWLFTIWYGRNNCNIGHFNENGYLLGVDALASDIGDQRMGTCLHNAAINVIASMTGALIEYMSKPENNPTYVQGPDEETISKIMENLSLADESVITEFLSTFRELGTFKMDPSEYLTDKEKELHAKMVGLYRKIMGE